MHCMLHINVEILEFPLASSRNFRSSHWTWICDCKHFVMFHPSARIEVIFHRVALLCFTLLCWRPTEWVSIHEHVLVISHIIVQRTKHYQHHQVEMCECRTKHKHFLLQHQLCHEISISISNINSLRKVTYFIEKLSIGTRKWWIVQQYSIILLGDSRMCNVHQAIYKSGVVNFGNCCKMVNWFE